MHATRLTIDSRKSAVACEICRSVYSRVKGYYDRSAVTYTCVLLFPRLRDLKPAATLARVPLRYIFVNLTGAYTHVLLFPRLRDFKRVTSGQARKSHRVTYILVNLTFSITY